MKLIFLYGLPASGKFTVAQQLAAITGIKLFHNHQVVDMLLSVFDFGSEPFVALREDIWLSVFEEAVAADLPALIFTFNPESSVSPAFIPNVMNIFEQSVGEVDFVELQCPLAELKQRMGSAERQKFQKLTSVPLFERLYAEGIFDTAHMPEPRVSIDTSTCTPAEAAQQIALALQLLLSPTPAASHA